jgi:hypothetical protein
VNQTVLCDALCCKKILWLLTVFYYKTHDDPPVVSISAIANYNWKGEIGVQPLQVDTWFRYDDVLKLVSMRRFSCYFPIGGDIRYVCYLRLLLFLRILGAMSAA